VVSPPAEPYRQLTGSCFSRGEAAHRDIIVTVSATFTLGKLCSSHQALANNLRFIPRLRSHIQAPFLELYNKATYIEIEIYGLTGPPAAACRH
jgi:hypothetical protein